MKNKETKYSLYNKNKYRKNILIGGLIYLIMISLIGVGFSSWAVINGSKDKSEIEINVGSIDDLINLREVKVFEYCKSGVIIDETIRNFGYFIFDVELLASTNVKSLSLSLVESNNNDFSLLNITYLTSDSLTFIYDKKEHSNQYELNNNLFKSNIDLSAFNSKNINLLIKIKFSFDLDNFSDNVYSKLTDKNLYKPTYKLSLGVNY